METRKIIKNSALIILLLILLIIIAIVAIFFNELKTLSSLKKLDEYPFYTMTYFGDYGFDEFLEVGASTDKDIEKFVIKRLLRGINIDLGIAEGGCTAFTAQNYEGQQIYGRNFDFPFSPPLLLYTNPKNGYASVSLVNLSYAGYYKEYLPEPYKLNSFLTLVAPYIPFDGMNECGVTMALLAVPYAEPPQDENQVSLNTTTAIRLVLDNASNVDEAVDLLKKYNYYFSGGVDCHYLIADTTGKSVIVEFLEEDVKIVEPKANYQIASNFIAYNEMNIGSGGNEFERFNIVDNYLIKSDGIISSDESMDLLSKVDVEGHTQWSVVYNMELKTFQICVSSNYNKVYEFEFLPISPLVR